MSSTFSFPPPPPPPPKRQPDPSYNVPPVRGNRQERGGFRGRSRGRGDSFGDNRRAGQHAGGYVQASHDQQWPQAQSSFHPNPLRQDGFQLQPQMLDPYPPPTRMIPGGNPNFPNASSTWPTATFTSNPLLLPSWNTQAFPYIPQPAGITELQPSEGHMRPGWASKRKHEHADTRHKPGKQARIETAPSVPSFGAPLPARPSFIPNTQSTSTSTTSADPTRSPDLRKKTRRSKKKNQLGLTPKGDEHEDTEEELDEEATMVAALAVSGGALQFEHRGQTCTLNTPAALAAWLDERHKRWPTAARAAERAKEESEKRAKQQVEHQRERQQRQDEVREKQEKLEEERRKMREKTRERDKEPDRDKRARNSIEKHLAKIEKLRRKLDKNEGKPAQQQEDVSKIESASPTTAGADEHRHRDLTHEIDNNSDSSSSSSCESDSNSSSKSAPPEQTTSKATGANRIPTSRPDPDATSTRRCRYFGKTGYCKAGAACRFIHERSEHAPAPRAPKSKPDSSVKQRKSLYQLFVEREQADDAKLVVDALRFLGDSGWLSGADAEPTVAGTETDI